jgi:hypothetical protein
VARVIVRILHAEPGPAAGPLERRLADARRAAGERHVGRFRAAGAEDVRLLVGPPDDTPFGRRLAALVADAGPVPAGLVVLGAGSIPLARPADVRAFVTTAASDEPTALANNRYSADAVAIARVDELPPIPDLPTDNTLPRWLDERAGWRVTDLRGRWHLGVDLDCPLDVELVRPGALGPDEGGIVRDRIAAVGTVLGDRRAELFIAGRTSAGSLRWLETHAACRVRVLVEERGLRASSRLALAGDPEAALRPPRPARSILGSLLELDGPEALGRRLADLADAAIVDSRVLLAHRLGTDERAWPPAEDRFASDLLLADRVADPWLQALTASAAGATIPVLLGGHTLVGPGVRLLRMAVR